MTTRQKEIIRAAMIYMLSNLDDVNEAFSTGEQNGERNSLMVDGIEINPIQEDEVNSVLREC